MTQKNNAITQPIELSDLGKRMLIGATIALILITIFIFPAIREPKPEWENFWMVRPLIIVPLAGATGGACNYFLIHLSRMNKILAYVLSFFIFIVGLWIGTVLGLDGTLWN